ncbi:hypothetical protein CR513_62822, partial [Mucuna pruriens]
SKISLPIRQSFIHGLLSSEFGKLLLLVFTDHSAGGFGEFSFHTDFLSPIYLYVVYIGFHGFQLFTANGIEFSLYSGS